MIISCYNESCRDGTGHRRRDASECCSECKHWFCELCLPRHPCVSPLESFDFSPNPWVGLGQASRQLDLGAGIWNLHKLGESSAVSKRDSLIGAMGMLFQRNPWLDVLALVEVQGTGVKVLKAQLPQHELTLLHSGPMLVGQTYETDKELLRSMQATLGTSSLAGTLKRISQGLGERTTTLSETQRQSVLQLTEGKKALEPLRAKLSGAAPRELKNRYTEYYPMVVRRGSPIRLVGIELYWQDGRVTPVNLGGLQTFGLGSTSFKEPDPVIFRGPTLRGTWYSNTTMALDDMFRPVIVYSFVKPPSKHLIKFGVIHTSPDQSEFIRESIFQQQLKEVFKRAQWDLENSDTVHWIFGGDLYLSPEARVVTEQGVPGGKERISQEKKLLKQDLVSKGWKPKPRAPYSLTKTVTVGNENQERTFSVGIDSLRNVLGISFEKQIPLRLNILAPVTATHLGDEAKWAKARDKGVVDLKTQVADFFLASSNWVVQCGGVFVDPDLMAQGESGLILSDEKSQVLWEWSKVSDHAPVGSYLGNFFEAETQAREILGYSRQAVTELEHRLELEKFSDEFELDLKKDSLELIDSSFENPFYTEWREDLEKDIQRREQALRGRAKHGSIYNYVIDRPTLAKRKREAEAQTATSSDKRDKKKQRTK